MRVEPFSVYSSDYFERLFEITLTQPQAKGDELMRLVGKRTGAVRVERTFAADSLSIRLSGIEQDSGDDPLFVYQWGLFAQGQRVYHDITDIQLDQIRAKDSADLGADQYLRGDMGRGAAPITVALLDSGIDWEHPDLKHALARKEEECEDGLPKLGKPKDLDGNGYAGDCIGWNFATTSSRGDHKPADDLGHGTHVAGLVAATPGNGTGIRGLGHNFRILPIKVFGKGNVAGKGIAFSQRIARGILYAVTAGAKVINLSLGWPRSLDTHYMREAFKEAHVKGVTLVAAAGNNDSTAPIFPCAYPEVLCVGATQADGRVADFSNYGSHVDLLAPGDHILSTYPMTEEPEAFSIRGYDVKSGTSQSAPLVAGAIAALITKKPELGPDEVLHRLAASARPLPDAETRRVAYGAVQLDAAMTQKAIPLLHVGLKGENSVVMGADGRFEILIPLRIFYGDKADFSIEVASTGVGSHLAELQHSISPGQTELSLKGQISSLDQESRQRLMLHILRDGERQRTLVRDLRFAVSYQPDQAQVFPIRGAKVAIVERIAGKLFPKLHSASRLYGLADEPVYFLQESVKEGPSIRLHLLRRQEGSYRPTVEPLNLPGAQKLVSVFLVDINRDGEEDVFVRSVVEHDGKKHMQYSFFRLNGAPLYPQAPHLAFHPEAVLLDTRNLRFMVRDVPGLGRMALPVFLAQGPVPKADRPSDPWDTSWRELRPRLYYLQPKLKGEKAELATRVVDTPSWRKRLQRRLGLDWDESIDLLHLLAQEDPSQTPSIVFSTGKNFMTKHYRMRLDQRRPTLLGGSSRLQGLRSVAGDGGKLQRASDQRRLGFCRFCRRQLGSSSSLCRRGSRSGVQPAATRCSARPSSRCTCTVSRRTRFQLRLPADKKSASSGDHQRGRCESTEQTSGGPIQFLVGSSFFGAVLAGGGENTGAVSPRSLCRCNAAKPKRRGYPCRRSRGQDALANPWQPARRQAVRHPKSAASGAPSAFRFHAFVPQGSRMANRAHADGILK